MRRTVLDSSAGASWTLQAAGPDEATPAGTEPIRADVPGEVHLDLLRAGLIPEPFDGANETDLAWIGRTDWTYRADFDWAPAEDTDASGSWQHDLVFDGLDTVALIRLNDAEVGVTANQHRSFRFEVTELLQPGRNQLEIAFTAPVTAAEQRAADLGERPCAYPHPYNALRKMASSYGWDWGPDLAGAGVWRQVRIESWQDVRIAAVRPLAGLDGADGTLEVQVELEWAPSSAEPVELSVEIEGTTPTDGSGRPTEPATAQVTVEPGHGDATLRLRLPDVHPWWPRGYGEQPLYDVRVRLGAENAWQGRVGFRDVTLSLAPDEHGSEFSLAVNGRPVFVKGANWIPDDAFLTRVDADRCRRSLTDATEAGMNLVRVWGGGIVESEAFYDACDELGLLVWQDFLLACAAYSEDEPQYSEFEAEAREQVTRLSAHPSLALWNGGNENLWGYQDWGWQQPLAGRSWGDGYYHELFPAIVAELDPRTPYIPGSPFSSLRRTARENGEDGEKSEEDELHPNDPRHGCTHLWEVWNRDDYDHYRDSVPRFVAEFGFQGPPAWSTLTSVVHDEPMDPFGPQMLVHQKAADGNLKLERGLGTHLPHWNSDADTAQVAMDDWHWLTQLNQARAVRFGIEHFRSHFPLNRGSIVWQLNDNWPVISWAAVDGHQIRKPLWYALREVYRDRFVTLQPRGDEQAPKLVLHNDTDQPWSGEVSLSRCEAGGTALASGAVSFELAPRSARTVQLGSELIVPDDLAAEYLLADAGEQNRAWWYFVADPQLRLARPEEALQIEVEPTATGYAVHAAASALVKDLSLFPDRLDPGASVDSALITLAAGESHTFVVQTGCELDPAALAGPPVLRSVNDLC